MNKLRRKEIFKIIQRINKILLDITDIEFDILIEFIEELIDALQDIFDDEESAMDNTPENFQSSQRYEESEYACDNLMDSIEELEEIDDDYSTEDIVRCLTNVANNLNNCI